VITKFTENHAWARKQGEVIIVGLTNYTQEQLGEVVFIEFPEIDRTVQQGEKIAVVESVKAASEIHSPVSGVIVAINQKLSDYPEKFNEDPEGNGWFYKIKISDSTEFDALMDRNAYDAFVKLLA